MAPPSRLWYPTSTAGLLASAFTGAALVGAVPLVEAGSPGGGGAAERGGGRRAGGDSAAFAKPSRRGPGRPATTNSEEPRLRILEMAIEAFAEGGYAGVSTRAVSERAGVTPSTVYHHFPTKRVLYIKAY